DWSGQVKKGKETKNEVLPLVGGRHSSVRKSILSIQLAGLYHLCRCGLPLLSTLGSGAVCRKNSPASWHSQSSSIGEESVCCQQRSSRFLARQAAIRNDNSFGSIPSS